MCLEPRCAFKIEWKANWREGKLQQWNIAAVRNEPTDTGDAKEKKQQNPERFHKKTSNLDSAQHKMEMKCSHFGEINLNLRWVVSSRYSWLRAGRFRFEFQAVWDVLHVPVGVDRSIYFPLNVSERHMSCDRRAMCPGCISAPGTDSSSPRQDN